MRYQNSTKAGCTEVGSMGRQCHIVWWHRLLVMVLLLASTGLAQNRSNPVGAPPTSVPPTQTAGLPTGVLVNPDEDYRLAAGDTIELIVDDAAELSQTHRLTAAGTFEMQFLGVIKAQGKTTHELARLIATQLREQDYLKQPQVKVNIKQYSGQIFFIQGAVQRPGLYQLEGNPSLLKLISLAGGLQENYSPTAFILRPTKKANQPSEAQLVSASAGAQSSAGSNSNSDDNEQYEFIKVPLTPIFQQGRTDQNVRLEPGDIVNIPPAKVFFVAGEVRAPGSFQLKEGTTLRQAISLAQGTTFKAALAMGVIFRDDPETGKREELRVDIGAVMSGKKADIVINPNDVIIVPNSRMKSVSGALLQALGVNSMRVPIP
jgi:polysaccharide biosynthesis/export protein